MRAARIAEIVGAIARQALADWGAERVALVDDGSPEAALAAGWLESALPAGALVRVSEPLPGLEPLLQPSGGEPAWLDPRLEALRVTARRVAGALLALPANKTALLLGGALPPEPFLPVGDLYASEVRELAGGWSAPEAVRALAEAAGGIEALDEALRARFDGRGGAGAGRLGPEARAAVESALRRGTASRMVGRLVPKLGSRTLGVDLFE